MTDATPSELDAAPADVDDAAPDPDCKKCRRAKAGVCKQHGYRPPAPTSRDRSPRQPRQAALARRIEEQITTLGAMVMFVNARDGELIVRGAPSQAAALDALAKQNPAVRRALENFLTVSVYGQLITAFAPTIVGVLANHGVAGIPPIAGVVVDLVQPSQSTNGDTTPAGGDPFAAAMTAMFTDGPGAPFASVVHPVE